MKVLRAFASAFVLVILLFAVPWVIVAWGAWFEVQALIQDPSLFLVPDDGHFVLAVLTVLGAIFWVILACAIIWEILDFTRRRQPGRHAIEKRGGPVLWARLLVRPLVAAIFAVAIVGGNLQPTIAGVTQSPAPIAASADAGFVPDPLLEYIADTEQTAQPLNVVAEPVTDEIYVVAPGDSLWSIAEKMYGDGRLWTMIAEENEDVVHSTSDLIRVGWSLRIPPQETVESDKDQGDTTDVVVVEPGESLWSIAEEHLGDGTQWSQIAEANQPLIVDPNLIQPGWRLVIPDDETASQAPDSVPQPLPDVDDGTSVTPEEVNVPDDQSDEPQPTGWISLGSESAGPEPTMAPQDVDESSTDVDNSTLRQVAGATAVLAGGVLLMLSRRRLGQLRARPVGRRILHPGDEGQELETALGVVASSKDRVASLVQNSKSTAGIVGVSHDGTDMWWIPHNGAQVCVGEDDDAEPVFADVHGSKPFLVCGEEASLGAVMRGITMNIAVEESEMDLHVQDASHLFETFDDVDLHQDYSEMIESLRQTLTARRIFLGGQEWETLRADPNFGEAWRPVIYVFLDPIDESQFIDVAEALQGPDIGVAVLVPMAGRPYKNDDDTLCGRLLVGSPNSVLDPGHIAIHPCLLETSPALTDLLQTSASDNTTPAWWSVSGAHTSVLPSIERESDMVNHPILKLLGPIHLDNAQGVVPTRAERACMEYCAWLLEHPGTTASAMSQGLMVAEGTRRSNMSRLRGWLGQDRDGNSYLPEAYSGRIWLHAGVSSDWRGMRQLVSSGVEEVETDKLMEALELVRGAPLADASPGQWHWAEEIRTDMMSVIRDIGVVTANRCLNQGDIDRARWAANRALVAAPEDELLLGVKVLIEHNAGNKLETDRLVSWITRNARNLGIDLLPQTMTILREVMSSKTGKE